MLECIARDFFNTTNEVGGSFRSSLATQAPWKVSNATNEVGGLFRSSLTNRQAPLESLKCQQRSWWIVQILSTNPSAPGKSQMPPTKLVDCSDPLYQPKRSGRVSNATNEVGGLFRSSLTNPSAPGKSLMPPTKLVDCSDPFYLFAVISLRHTQTSNIALLK
jgi:hypothetical protein